VLCRLTLTLGLFSVAAIWGGTFVAVQDAVRGYSSLSFVLLRFALAALVLAPVSAGRVGRRELVYGASIGVALGAGMLLQTEGLRTTTSTNSGLITGLYVVFAPLFALALFRARVSRRVWAAVALSVLGLALVTGGQPGDLRVGDGLTLLAALIFGVQIALLSRYSPGSHAGALTLVQLCVTILLVAPAVALSGAAVLPERPEVWRALLLTGLGASAYGFWMQTYAQARIPAGRAAVIMATEPVFAAIAGYAAAGDRLTGVQ
jgi:drug/metabolite transporter (DMT)-like permease